MVSSSSYIFCIWTLLCETNFANSTFSCVSQSFGSSRCVCFVFCGFGKILFCFMPVCSCGRRFLIKKFFVYILAPPLFGWLAGWLLGVIRVSFTNKLHIEQSTIERRNLCAKMGKKPCRYVMERRKLKDKPRKILNLEERVQAIRMYDEIPVYQRVASAFKCSWEQIKNVVANRKEILKYYASCQIIDVMKDDPKVVRHKKINFLGNCMYEYIKRAHFHKLQTITDEVIRDRAMEFKEIINIEKFFPNRAWIRDFKSVFNIDLDHINQIIIAKKPQRSLNCKDIITYCAKEVDNALSSQPGSSRNQTNDDSDGNNTQGMEDLDDNNDDEDDPLESFYDDETGGGNDEGGDDEIINENEEGPTINYGDYEDYHDESQQDVKPDIKELEKLNKKFGQKGSTEIIAPENIKEEPNDNHSILASCLLGIDKNLKRPLQKQPFKRPSSSSSSSTTTTSKQLPVNSYEEALKLMRPLEEFALYEEDFKAINLLNQLAEVYEKAKKRKRLEK